MKPTRLVLSLACASLIAGSLGISAAETPPPVVPVPAAAPVPPVPPTKAEVEALLATAQDWLLAQEQPTGSFLPADARLSLGISALAAEVLLQSPGLPATDPRMTSALAFIRSHKQPDGGIYVEPEGLCVYGTAVGLSALIAGGEKDAATITGAQDFMFKVQVADKESPVFGGLGYGTPKTVGKADLSNTHLAIDALVASGISIQDPRMRNLVTFLEHCQHLSSHNKLPWVDMSPKEAGGAIYNPDPKRPTSANAPAAPGAVPKQSSYASMTYALVSSYLELGVPKEDERITSALLWLNTNYTPFSNSGRVAGKEVDGLYYTYWLMAKTNHQLGVKFWPQADGKKIIDWRTDLIAALNFRKRPAEGGKPGAYWINESKTWGETNPVLVTAYVVGTLKHILATL